MQTGLIHLIHSQRFKYLFRDGLIINLTKSEHFNSPSPWEKMFSEVQKCICFFLSSEFVHQCFLGANDLQEPRGATEIQDRASVVRDGQCAHRLSHHQEQAVHVPPKPRLIPAQQWIPRNSHPIQTWRSPGSRGACISVSFRVNQYYFSTIIVFELTFIFIVSVFIFIYF